MANKDLVFCHRTKKNTFWIYFLVLALLPISSISAISQDYVQEKSLTVKLDNKTVKEVLDDIEKNSSFIFMYSKELLNVLDKVVTIQVENEDIASIMAVLAKETNINYEIKGKQIILSKASEQQKRQQGININGSVWDEQGNPLPGVNVTVKSTTIGTTTDVNGNYFLEVPSKNSVLVFSYIGFKSKDIQVGNQININVNLYEEYNSLEEVVVVGYGSQKKASVVGAIPLLNLPSCNKEPTVPYLITWQVSWPELLQYKETVLRVLMVLTSGFVVSPLSRAQVQVRWF